MIAKGNGSGDSCEQPNKRRSDRAREVAAWTLPQLQEGTPRQKATCAETLRQKVAFRYLDRKHLKSSFVVRRGEKVQKEAKNANPRSSVVRRRCRILSILLVQGPLNTSQLELLLQIRRQDVVRDLDGMLDRGEVALADPGVRLKVEPSWRITVKGKRMGVEYDRTADLAELRGFEQRASRVMRQLGGHFRTEDEPSALRSKADELERTGGSHYAADFDQLRALADEIEQRRSVMKTKSHQKGGALARI